MLLIAGSLLTIVGVIVKTWLDRRTYSSNRLFELRIEALNRVWQAFNEMKGLFASRIEIGVSRWSTEYMDKEIEEQTYKEKAGEALTNFRRSIDNEQVVLPSEVIDILRQMDVEYFLYLDDDEAKGGQFQSKIKRLLKDLTAAVNKTMAKQTHQIKLRFRT